MSKNRAASIRARLKNRSDAATCARAAALTGSAAGALPGGLILEAKTVLQRG